VKLSLPDEVRAALRGAGLSDDDVRQTTGDDLRKAIGDQLTYQLVVALAGQKLTVARWPFREASLPQDDLIERNLDILRLRVVEKMTFAAIGREVGLSTSRVPQILRTYYGVDTRRGREEVESRTLTIPAASLPVVREALRMEMLAAVNDLHADLTNGEAIDLGRFDEVRKVLCKVGGEGDATQHGPVVMYRDDPVLAQALRSQLDTEHHMADTPERGQRIAEANAATIERLLAAMP
jgi:Sigma-70, region 4